MTVKISYRKQLLRAVEAFLEEAPSAHMKALRIIDRALQHYILRKGAHY